MTDKKKKKKATWWSKRIERKKWLESEVDFRLNENLDLLKRLQEREEEFAMLKKLNRLQAEEIKQSLDKATKFEQLYGEAETARKLMADGVESQPGDITAISVVKVQEKTEETPETWATVTFTLDSEGKTIVNRTQGPDCQRQFALDNAKIAFVEAFDDQKTTQ